MLNLAVCILLLAGSALACNETLPVQELITVSIMDRGCGMHQGTPMVQQNDLGETFTFCGSDFTDHEATLICKAAGYAAGSALPPSMNDMAFRQLRIDCMGHERHLLECNVYDDDSCMTMETAEVVCAGTPLPEEIISVCPPGCECFGGDSCMHCHIGFYQEDMMQECKVCPPSCIDCWYDTMMMTVTCGSCHDPTLYFDAALQECIPCPTGCAECWFDIYTGLPYCAFCLDDSFYYDPSIGFCQPFDEEVACQGCFGAPCDKRSGCHFCPEGFFRDHYNMFNCQPCPSNCMYCYDDMMMGGLVCDWCMEGYYKEDGVCKDCGFFGCGYCEKNKFDEMECTECARGYGNHLYDMQRPDQQKCVECTDHCINCYQDDTVDGYHCWECESGYYVDMNGRGCEREGCSPFCSHCSEEHKCDVDGCNEGSIYDPSNEMCFSCAYGCDECKLNGTGKTACLKCRDGFALHPNTSECLHCIEDCRSCSVPGTCDECREGYHMRPSYDWHGNAINACAKDGCAENCRYCLYQGLCDDWSCLNGYYRNSNLTCDECEGCTDCNQDDGSCYSWNCLPGYFHNGFTCEEDLLAVPMKRDVNTDQEANNVHLSARMAEQRAKAEQRSTESRSRREHARLEAKAKAERRRRR